MSMKSFRLSTNGVWIVPDGVTSIWAKGVGGGGGGGGGRTGAPNYLNGGSGGGAGEHMMMHPMKVTPGEEITVIVGPGGEGGLLSINGSNASLNPGSPGGATTITWSGGSITLEGGRGGGGGIGGANSNGGNGGGSGGGKPPPLPPGQSGVSGAVEASRSFMGGPSGGSYNQLGFRSSGIATGVDSTPFGSSGSGYYPGGSGAPTMYGYGGLGGDGGVGLSDAALRGKPAPASSYGAGGGGSGAHGTSALHLNTGTGGAGADGAVEFFWMACDEPV